MTTTDFEFHYHSDSPGYDMFCVGKKPINELKEICKSYKRCIGFNTFGYLKFYIQNKNDLIDHPAYTEDDSGLYVHIKRYNKMLQRNKNKSYINFEDYEFYSGKDSSDYDIKFAHTKSIEELKSIADNEPKCVGFNTLGFLKHHIKPESNFIELNSEVSTEGLYVKKTRFRVKMLCNWCTPKELCDDWNRMSKGNYRWNDIEITWEDKNVDFYVIINKPRQVDFYKPERTIIFHMEPWCGNPQQSWGVKTWGIWAEPDEERFLQVRSHKNFYNNGFWQLAATYNDLKTMTIEKTKLMSSICSSKYFDPGHIKRIDFLKFIESKDDNVVNVDIYNSDNAHNFKGYVGPHPQGYKDIGIMPYKYYFMPENNEEVNFMTEKIWEPLLTETVAFYWGCPNIAVYIDPRAYILLDLDNFEKSFDIIKNAIINNEWEKRIDVIRMEKQKVLEYFNFFPTLERIIHQDFKFNNKPTDQDVKYHKYFSQIINKQVNNVAFIDNNTETLNELLSHIEVSQMVNHIDFIYIINHENKLDYEILSDKIKIINYATTSNLIKLFSKYHKDSNILYLSSTGDNNSSYFLVDNYKFCLDLLNVHDMVGITGDSWWSNSKYVGKENMNKFTLSESNMTKELVDSFYTIDDKTRIKCVNLERRQDRKDFMINLLTHIDLMNDCDFFVAVDGQKLVRTDELYDMFKDNDFGSKRGVVGCALSHYQLWNQLLDDKVYDNYIILEDDIEVDRDFKFKLVQMQKLLQEKSDWDVCYFGFHMFNRNRERYQKKISTIDHMSVIPYDVSLTIGGTFGYIVNKTCASKFVNFIKENGVKHGIDYLMFHYHNEMKLNQYELVPQIVFSEFVNSAKPVDSDIQYDTNRLF